MSTYVSDVTIILWFCYNAGLLFCFKYTGGIALLLQLDEHGNMAAAVQTSEASASGGALLDYYHDA